MTTHNTTHIALRVWGDWACFTRPEMKVERVSYPVMTPSAARGCLEAVFWEPQMYYVIDSIRTLKRGRWTSFRRNEVTSRISLRNAREWMSEPNNFQPIQAGGGASDGTQRNMLALEGVEYIVRAEVRLSGLGKSTNQHERKYTEEFERRARSGKCFHRPYLGVREFAADFDWHDVNDGNLKTKADGANDDSSIAWNDDLGLMLYDVFDHEARAAGFRWLSESEIETARATRTAEAEALKPAARRKREKESLPTREGSLVAPRPAFFHARVKDSVLDCHPSRVAIVRQKIAQSQQSEEKGEV